MSKKQLTEMLTGKIDLSKVMANGGELVKVCKEPVAGFMDETRSLEQPQANVADASCTNNGSAFDYYKSM